MEICVFMEMGVNGTKIIKCVLWYDKEQFKLMCMKNSKEYLDKVIGIMEKPYFYEMGLYGVDDIDDQKYVLEKVFGIVIRINGRRIYDSNKNEIYYEDSNGYWSKSEYDSNNKQIYYENSNCRIIDIR